MVSSSIVMLQAFFFSFIFAFARAIDDVSCSVFFAPSSLPNAAGLGLYAARDFALGESIGPLSIAIPWIDDGRNRPRLLNDFLWDSAGIGGFGEASSVNLLLPGAPSLIQSHTGLENVIVGGLTLDGEFQRDWDPMAGSFTAYHSVRLRAKHPIRKGEELFVASKHAINSNSSTITDQHYETAQLMVNDLERLENITTAQWSDLLYKIRQTMTDQKIASLLPKSKYELKRAVDLGLAKSQLIDRDFDWIRHEGTCLDGIRQGISSGSDQTKKNQRGAFATRFVPMGDKVMTSPLLPLDKSVLGMMNSNNNTQQLLLNYCFGHRQASVVFCPLTNVVLTNHAGTREANVRIQFKEPAPLLQSQSIDEFWNKTEDEVLLSFEYIALKDIQVGEELLIDYGEEWEFHYNQHLNHGVSRNEQNQNPEIAAHFQNKAQERALVLSDKMPSHLVYECSLYPHLKMNQANKNEWEEFSSNQMVHKANWPSSKKLLYGENNNFAGWYPCQIVDVSDDNKYNVHLYAQNGGPNATIVRRFRGVPRNRIRFADAPYRSDQHLPWSFRHSIMIPDDSFPLPWRNDYKIGTEWNLGKINLRESPEYTQEAYEQALRKSRCGLYMAKSNIPNAGFGTYAGIEIPAKGLTVGSMMPEIPVNIQKDLQWPGTEYVWSSKKFEENQESPTSLRGGFGAIANSHAGIFNMEQISSARYNPMLDRRHDPGAGAFSPYDENPFVSRHSVAAGEELFVTYGEHWFLGRKGFEGVPLSKNFRQGDHILALLWSMYTLEGASLQKDTVEEVIKIFQNHVVQGLRTRNVLAAFKSLDDIQHVINRNGTAMATTEPRSNEWLEKNGYCLDHVYVKKSSIEQAGNGAFSRRFLPKGSRVIVAPGLAAFRDYDLFRLPQENSTTKSLIYNYHIGHRNSSVLFFPVSQMIAINHNSKTMPGGKQANAKIQFSKDDKKSNYILNRPLEDIKKEKYSSLLLEVVAMHDIHPDEEIFIDYGRKWEEAWKKHVAAWKPPCSGLCTKSSLVILSMNRKKFYKDFHKWTDDHMTYCKASTQHDDNTNVEKVSLKKNGFHGDQSSGETGIQGVTYDRIAYNHEGFRFPPVPLLDESLAFPCMIIKSNSTDNTFDVRVFQKILEEHFILNIKNMAEEFVIFRPRPFKGDTTWEKAFRHEIEILDEDFPDLWKDLIDE